MCKTAELVEKRNAMIYELQRINQSIEETQRRLVQLQRSASERAMQIADLFKIE